MSDRLRVRVGVALLLAAALAFCLRLAVGSHDRAWSPDASPRESYELVLGTAYRISTVEGPPKGVAAPVLSCTIQPIGADGAPGPASPLTVTGISGERVTHDIASFISPLTGAARIECPPGTPVFVDGAEDVGLDVSSLLLVVGITLGVAGLLLAASAVRAQRPETRAKPGAVTGVPAGGTTVEAAPGV